MQMCWVEFVLHWNCLHRGCGDCYKCWNFGFVGRGIPVDTILLQNVLRMDGDSELHWQLPDLFLDCSSDLDFGLPFDYYTIKLV